MNRTVICLLLPGFAALLICSPAAAQQPAAEFGLIDGTIVFLDAESDSRCGAVNTFNADFIIRSCDRRLVILSGEDRTTPYSVDTDYNVIHDSGQAAGRIRFATDNDGFRQVFWLSDENFTQGENFVLNYVSQSDQLAVATVTGAEGEEIALTPLNISQTECDPFASYDGGQDIHCPRSCGAGTGGALLAMALLFSLIYPRPGGTRHRRDSR